LWEKNQQSQHGHRNARIHHPNTFWNVVGHGYQPTYGPRWIPISGVRALGH
jgi:hypothetical protein